MNNDDLFFLDVSSDSSEHANLPRVLTFHEAPELFVKTKPKLAQSIKLQSTYNFNNLYLSKNNNHDLNLSLKPKNSKNGIKLIDLDNKVQNGNISNLKHKTTYIYKKKEKEKEKGNSHQPKEKKDFKKSLKDNHSQNRNKNKNNIEPYKKINSQNILTTKLNSSNNQTKDKKTKKTTWKMYTKQLTRNNTQENITKTKTEFRSKINLAITLDLKSNSIKDKKLGSYTRSLKILPPFKFDSPSKQKKKANKNNYLIFKKNTKKKYIKKEIVKLNLPLSKEKIKNKNDELKMKEYKDKKNNKKEKINNINILSNNRFNIIKSKIIGDAENEKNNISHHTSLFLKTEKSNLKSHNNISLEKNIKIVPSFEDLLLNNKNKNNIKSHYVLSKAGTDEYGHMKINQDSYLVLEGVNGLKDFNIYGVFDGHGPEGHLISQFVTRYFQLEFKRNKIIEKIKDLNIIYDKLKANNFRMIKDIFIKADNILRDQEIESRNSGTTCVIVIHLGEHIICANAGDSRAILVYDKYKNNNYKVFPLSVDSKPELKEEKDRIIKMGGIVEKVRDQYGQEIGPYRVWNKSKEYPGLAMSRSIGDFSGKNLGIIPEPEIIETNFGININYIVICSDGVWEFLNNDDIMKIGNKFYKENNPRGFCKEVVDYSTKFWKKEDVVIDDITILAIFF